MSDLTEEPVAAAPEPVATPRRGRARPILVVVGVLVLVGAGVGTALAVTGGTSGNASPAAAVQALLTAANKSDVLGALDALAPGERQAIEPGLKTLDAQLQRLQILSPSANLNSLSGISLHFSGIQTTTAFLDPTVAAVTITKGTVTSNADPAKLPLGSFVTGLAGNALQGKAKSQTQSASTGKSAIVTINDGGSWYVSLGYTIAVDSLRSSGGSGAPPAASQAVQPAGADSPQDAVRALLNSTAALDLRGIIAIESPGEMGVLQRYAPMFLGKSSTALNQMKRQVSFRVTGLQLSTQPLGNATLVKIDKIGFSLTTRGVTISLSGRCIVETFQGRSKRICPSAGSYKGLLKLLPAGVRTELIRLSSARPDTGIVTVQESGKWYISPTATVLQAVNAGAAIVSPQDLQIITSYAKNPAAAKRLFTKIGQSLLGSLVSGLQA